MFLADMLDELGFIAREAGTADIRTVLRDFHPDLIVLGPLGGTREVQSFLKTLQAQVYGGTVMLFGGRSSEALIRGHELGEQTGLTMLPPPGTPFRAHDLDANLERFQPIRPPTPLPVDIDEALCDGWLAPVQDRSAVTGAARRRGAHSCASPHMGRRRAGLFHPGGR